jgi:hypothetical protein
MKTGYGKNGKQRKKKKMLAPKLFVGKKTKIGKSIALVYPVYV